MTDKQETQTDLLLDLESLVEFALYTKGSITSKTLRPIRNLIDKLEETLSEEDN